MKEQMMTNGEPVIVGGQPNILKIEVLHACVAKNQNGDEGLMAAMVGDTWMPLIAADADRLKNIYQIAEKLQQQTGQQYRILRFGKREDVTDEVHGRYG